MTDLVGVENPQDGVQVVHLYNRKKQVATRYVVNGKEEVGSLIC